MTVIFICVLTLLLRNIYCEQTLDLVLIDQSNNNQNSGCLDGSPAGYYIVMSNSSHNKPSNKWLIYHEGGGWCTSLDDCYARSTTLLGSTVNRPQQIHSSSLTAEFSNDPNLNMLMHDWNKVLIIYCDGGSFTGNNITRYDDKDLYFRGKENLKAVKNSLVSRGLSNATDIVISGCSAGGLAVYLHLDWWRDTIAAYDSSIRVTGLAIDGYFLDRNDVYGFYGISDYMRWILIHMNSSTNSKCMQQNTLDEGKCMFPQYVSSYVTTPFFIYNSKFNYHTILGTGTRVEEFGSLIASSINTSVNLINQTRGCFVDTCVHHCTRDTPYINGYNSTYAFKLFYEKLYAQQSDHNNRNESLCPYCDVHIDGRVSVCLFCCGTDKVLLALIVCPTILCFLCIMGVVIAI
jgi:hypothetical protein